MKEYRNQMGESCSMHRDIQNSYRIFVGKTSCDGNLEDIGVDGRVMLK
jgi:hypothetical protein